MGSKYRSDNNINNIIIIGNAKKCLSIYISFRYNAHLAEQRTDKKKKKHHLKRMYNILNILCIKYILSETEI